MMDNQIMYFLAVMYLTIGAGFAVGTAWRYRKDETIGGITQFFMGVFLALVWPFLAGFYLSQKMTDDE